MQLIFDTAPELKQRDWSIPMRAGASGFDKLPSRGSWLSVPESIATKGARGG